MQRDGRGRCSATNRSGAPCSGTARPGSDRCAWHDPAMQERIAAGRAKGGRAKSNVARATRALPSEPMTAAEIHAWLGIVFRATIDGKMAPGVAVAVATVAKAMAQVAEVGHLEDEIAELRSLIGRGRSS